MVVLLLSGRDIYYAYYELEGSRNGELDTLLLFFPVACWVARDSYKRKASFPSDWVLIFFMVFLPAYLYKTRKYKGVLILIYWIVGLFCYFWIESKLLFYVWMKNFES